MKDITGTCKNRIVEKLVNDNGELVVDQESFKQIWKKYIENLFCDEKGDPSSLSTETGPTILVNEIEAAINLSREGKAPDPDGIQTEFLKLLDEDSIKMRRKMFNNIYDTGDIPKE